MKVRSQIKQKCVGDFVFHYDVSYGSSVVRSLIEQTCCKFKKCIPEPRTTKLVTIDPILVRTKIANGQYIVIIHALILL